MDLVTIRELFKNKEKYLDKKVTVGGFKDVWIYRGQ